MSPSPARLGARCAIAAVALAGCSGQVGTVSISLATAPGSHLLDQVETLRLTVTNPHQVTTAQRTSSGFTIALDLPATGDSGSLIVDGLDATGAVIATGASPPFPIGAITAKVVVYMAAPNTIGAAPVELVPARSELAAGPLNYGAIFAGGRDVAGVPSDAIAIYNTFDHSLVVGLALPAPRSELVLGVDGTTKVYLFGGLDSASNPTATTWVFDTSVAPSGAYQDFGDKTGFARAGELAIAIGNARFLISGTPVGELSGLDGSLVARPEVASLPATGASVTATDGIATAIFAGAGGVTRFRSGGFDSLEIPAAVRTGHAVIAMPGGKIGVFCGDPTALRIDAASGATESFPAVPSAVKTGCAVASTRRHVLVAGGTLPSGEVSPTAEIYDAATLAPVASQPLVVPRTGATAIALPNDQILIAGGTDASGAPIATVELFTPPSPE